MQHSRRIGIIAILGVPLSLVACGVMRATHGGVPSNTDIANHAFLPKIPHGEHTLAGRVTDDYGDSVGKVAVSVVLLPAGQDLPYKLEHGARPTVLILTDASGRYTLADLPEGHYGISVIDGDLSRVSAAHPSKRSAMGKFALTTAETSIASREKTKILNLTASRGVTISGQVIDIATGRPIPKIHVWGGRAEPGKNSTEGLDGAIADSEGHYFLRLPAGKVYPIVTDRQNRLRGQSFQLSLGQSAVYNFRITAPQLRQRAR